MNRLLITTINIDDEEEGGGLIEVNKEARVTLCKIENDRKDLNKSSDETLQTVYKNCHDEKGMPVALFSYNTNKFMKSSNIHKIHQMITKKSLYANYLNQLFTTGINIDWKKNFYKGKKILDLYLVRKLIETGELPLYGLLRMLGISILFDSIPQLNNPSHM